MSRVHTINNLVAVEPYKIEGMKTVVVGGFAKSVQKTSLVKLKVVLPFKEDMSGEDLGHAIIKESDLNVNSWAKDILSIDGKNLILVPMNNIVGFEK